jgi:hypothetical protein
MDVLARLSEPWVVKCSVEEVGTGREGMLGYEGWKLSSSERDFKLVCW